MREFTYLIYVILWESLVVGGTGYAVFVLDYSGWWFLLAAIFSGSAIQPKDWFR